MLATEDAATPHAMVRYLPELHIYRSIDLPSPTGCTVVRDLGGNHLLNSYANSSRRNFFVSSLIFDLTNSALNIQ